MPETNNTFENNVQEAVVVVENPTSIKDQLKDVVTKHTDNQSNVCNNRGFATYQGAVVEVVRRGRDRTRIRRSLTTNGETELVPTPELTDYTHPNQPSK